MISIYTIIIENNSHIKKFFEHNKIFEDYIRDHIINATLDLINYSPYKIKIVKGYKYLDKTIYEYKIPLKPGLDCRVAYIFKDDKIIFFFMSNIIRKNEFTKLIAKLKDVKKI